MIERLVGIVIEVVIGDVVYDGEPVKRLHAETEQDLMAQAKAYVNSHHTAQHDASLWQLRTPK